MKKPELPNLKQARERGLDPGFSKIRATAVERSHSMSVLGKSVIVIVVSSIIMLLMCVAAGEVWTFGSYMNNIFCNTIALVFVVLCLDTIVNSNSEKRRKRDEARRIMRYNRLIQPDIDLYLVRKNMVITPNGKSVHKFQVDAKFTVKDMKDMYSPSELVADVGISKIRRFGHYQSILKDDFHRLVENVDFAYYPEVAEAAMRFLNATAYGEAALEAVIGYEDARSGTKSMRVMVIGMIKEEPEDERFMDANPVMKNVHLVHQMINEQEKAIGQYLKLIRKLEGEDPTGKREMDGQSDYS